MHHFSQYVFPLLFCETSRSLIRALAADGSWHSFQLSASESFSPPAISPPLALVGLSFLPAANSLATIDRLSVSILALTSSHVLLAGVSSLSQEIVCLLWDLKFSVLLASHTLPMPSTLSSPLSIQLVLGPQTLTKTGTQVTGQALLVISSLPSGKDKEKKAGTEYKSTSVLFIVPYAVQSASSISAALGLGRASEKWLRTLDEQCSPVKPAAAATSRTNLLSTIRSAIEGGRGQAATAAFFNWASKDMDADSVSISNTSSLPPKILFFK